eukprot:2855472-Alexandrium_andersonii.AAC.1
MSGKEAGAWFDAQYGYAMDRESFGEAITGIVISGLASAFGPSHDQIDAALWRQYQHDIQQP